MHSSYINSNTNGDTSRSIVNQQRLTSFGYYNHEITPNLNTAHDMQFAMNNSSYHYNKSFLTGDGSTGDCFNSHKVILEKKGMRSSNKDRHSKINTARGPRDRRMRLSITVAKEFFRLQDLLGFDKCSTTIEWLLMKSKPAICDLQLQSSGNSECEVTMSGIAADEEKLINSCSGDYKKERRKLDQFVAKKTRKEARARARKRAAEKRNIKLQEYSKDRSIRALDHQVMDGNRRQLGPWIQFGERQGDQLEYPSPDSHFKQLGIDGDDSTCIMSSSWSPSLLFSYQHSLGTSHEHELSDFQNKPWESINN